MLPETWQGSGQLLVWQGMRVFLTGCIQPLKMHLGL